MLAIPRLELYLDHDRPLEPAEVDRLRDLVRRRGRREPLAYLLGSWGFYGLDLHCDPRALVPRPETEVLVERCLALLAATAAPSIVDVGTGTGAIALALAAQRPDATVTAIDLSPTRSRWRPRTPRPTISPGASSCSRAICSPRWRAGCST